VLCCAVWHISKRLYAAPLLVECAVLCCAVVWCGVLGWVGLGGVWVGFGCASAKGCRRCHVPLSVPWAAHCVVQEGGPGTCAIITHYGKQKAESEQRQQQLKQRMVSLAVGG
jgi:hypothetical protein